MNMIASLLNLFSDYLGNGKEYSSITDPLTGKTFMARDYFSFKYKHLGLPNEVSYLTLASKVKENFPEILFTIYSLSGKVRTIFVSLRVFIDPNVLENIIEAYLPGVTLERKSKIAFFKGGVKIAELKRSLRRFEIYPAESPSRLTVSPDILRLFDEIEESKPFIDMSASSSAPAMVPILTRRGELALLTKMELAQEMQRTRQHIMMGKILSASQDELARIIDSF